MTDIDVPLRMRSASNPGGVGHGWVKGRFISKEAEEALKRGESGVYWKDNAAGERTAFIPAKIADNPAIDEAEYSKNLMHLDPVTRERLMNGDWSVQEGSLINPGWLRYFRMTGEILLPLNAQLEKIGQEVVVDCRELTRFVTIDTAGTEDDIERETKGKPPSWTVIAVWEYWAEHRFLFLRHVWRGRVGFTGILDAIRQVKKDWNPHTVNVENAHWGGAVRDMLRNEVAITLMSTKVEEAKGKAGQPGKVGRAAPLLNMLSEGRVFLPVANNSWRQELEAEWLSWTGLKDETADQIDVASYAAVLCKDLGTTIKVEDAAVFTKRLQTGLWGSNRMG